MVALFLYQHNVPTVLRAEWLADFAELGVIYRLFQRIDIAEWRNPAQLAAGLLYARVGTQLTRYGVESLYRLSYGNCLIFALRFRCFTHVDHSTDSHSFIGFINLRQCSLFLFGCSALWALDSDMCGTAVFGQVTPAHLDKAVHRLLVLQVLRRSLRTIALQFLLECLGGVNTLCLGFGHFELEVNEHVEVLVHGLGVDSTCLVVLLIDVQKFLCTNGLAVNGHQGL